MTSQEIQAQLERADFASTLQISTYREEGEQIEGHNDLAGTVFRVQGEGGGGFELLLTDKAVKMYGAGPALTLTIGQLKKHIAQGLPALEAGGVYQRLTFVGD